MTYFEATLLGALQGLTEFLPVSSSGHLVLAQSLLDVKQPGVSFEVLLHGGTLLAVLVFFRRSIIRLIQSLFDRQMRTERVTIGYLIIGTIPAGLAGIILKGFFERTFSDPVLTSVMLLVTGVILLTTRLVRTGTGQVKLLSSLTMGMGQALAIMPGISRSGSTIAAGMLAGVQPAQAAEFSFLLSIPAILGATLLQMSAFLDMDASLLGHYAIGGVVAFLTGLLAVQIVMSVVRRGRFHLFAVYCFVVGGVGLYLSR